MYEQMGKMLNVTSAKTCCCQWKFCGIKFAEISCYFIQNDSLHLVTVVLYFSSFKFFVKTLT